MLIKGRGRKDDKAQKKETQVTDGATPEEEETLDPFEEQVQQIFEVAAVCQDMAGEMYPITDDIEEGSALHLAMLAAQVQCHMALFNAVINNAGSMVSALSALTQQFGGVVGGIAPGMPQGIASPDQVLLIRPPGGGV